MIRIGLLAVFSRELMFVSVSGKLVVVSRPRLTAVAWAIAVISVASASALAVVHFRERPAIAEREKSSRTPRIWT